MNRDTCYQLALLTYPKAYRLEHGPELVATANDLSPNRWSLRQSWSLVTEGLRTRARLAARDSARQLVAQGLALGLILIVIPVAARGLSQLLGAMDTYVSLTPPTAWIAGIGGAATLALLSRSTRWPTALALTILLACLLGSTTSRAAPLWPLEQVLAVGPPTLVILSIAWWLAFRTDSPGGLHIIATFASLTALVIAAWLAPHPHFILDGPYWVGLLVLGTALAFFDPRLLIAACADAAIKVAALTGDAFSIQVGGASEPLHVAMLTSLPLLAIVVAGLALSRWRIRLLFDHLS